MLINKHNLAVRALASKDAGRFSSNGILLRNGCTVATNGHALAIVTTPTIEEADFPHVDGLPDGPVEIPDSIIALDAAAAIAKALPKRQPLKVLEHAKVGRTDDKVTAVTTDLETTTPHTTRIVEGEFPKYESCIPDSKDTTLTIGFNAKLLSDALALAASALGDTRAPIVKLEFSDATSAVKITGHNDTTGQDVTVVVMPCRF